MKIRKHIKVISFILMIVLGVSMFAGCKEKKNKNTEGTTNPSASSSSPTSDSSPSSPVATPGASGTVSNVTINDKVDDSVKDSIDFSQYENNSNYELSEIESKTDVKLIAPVYTYISDQLKLELHVELVKNDNGDLILELLGTDFKLPSDIETVEVKWNVYCMEYINAEWLYKFENLCISIDDDVYFYKDVFYSPVVEGRDAIAEPLK